MGCGRNPANWISTKGQANWFYQGPEKHTCVDRGPAQTFTGLTRTQHTGLTKYFRREGYDMVAKSMGDASSVVIAGCFLTPCRPGQSPHEWCWLDKDKLVLKQIGSPDTPLRFCVKFYTPDPGLLEDELTRYLFALQVRKDLLRGELRCSENTAALLASYIVQAEIGDFDMEECPDPTYLAVFKFVPEHLQTHQFMAKVMDYHKQHIGESPSEADLNLLDTARKVELYGIKMQSAKDHEGVHLNLAVAHLGVLVFQQYTKINTFSWAKVRKLSFKRKKFLIKLHADTYGYYKDTVEFFFDTRDRCKLFWKRCIEHHAFFRCQVVAKVARNKTRVVSRGSSFRYCGRTQKQLVEYVRENIGKRPHFERSTSGRISSRSTSVTPKISSKPGMHSSSADLHTSSGSRSSGSHILDSNHTPGSGILRDSSGTPHSAMRVESVDVHSDSSMSGSRSLNSPRLEHGLSIDQDVIEAVNARTEGMTDDDEEDDEDLKSNTIVNQGISHVSSETKGAHSLLSPELNSPVRYVGLYSEVGSPDYLQGDGVTSPEVDVKPESVRAKVVSPLDNSDQAVSCGNRTDTADVSAIDIGDSSKKNNSDDSVCPSASGLPLTTHNSQTPRPHLDLKLTNITSSSSVDLPKNPPEPSHLSTHASVSSPSTPLNTANLSASQNVSDRAIKILKSKFVEDLASKHPTVQSGVNADPSSSKKVSSLAMEHPAEGKESDLSPPFPSPPPPLSPQYLEEDVKRTLDASPSSCVTDTALIRQESKVRLASRVSSLDSNRFSPVTETKDGSKVSPSQQAGAAVECKLKSPSNDQNTERVSQKVEVEETKQETTKHDEDKNSAARKDTSHGKFPNGNLVGAGAPLKEQLEAEHGPNRKLSAGTDLIEDIPYILHRRLDGQKEETAVFRVSEADKLRRQRSLSPASKSSPLSCAPSVEPADRPITPDRRCLSPEVKGGEGHKPKFHSDKSPTLNRRIEFVNVHKLPSRTSYSSVDDTTSPSLEQELLKHLEQGALSPEAVTFSSPEKKSKLQTASSDTDSSFGQKSHLAGESDSSLKQQADNVDNVSSKDYKMENKTEEILKNTDSEKPSAGLECKDNVDTKTSPSFKDRTEKTAAEASISNEQAHVNKSSKNESAAVAIGDDIQFYSPKIPGTQRLKNIITTSISDDSPDALAPEGEGILKEAMKKSEQTVHSQYFEVSKPQPCLGREKLDILSTSAAKDVPKSLSLKSIQVKVSESNLNSFGKPQSPSFLLESKEKVSKETSGGSGWERQAEVKSTQRAPSLSSAGRNSTSSTSSSDNNQFLIDLPSPAAALFYSDSDSPPPTHSRVSGSTSPLTFSTFRPDPAEESLLKVEESVKEKTKMNRWSLQSVEEAEEMTDYKVIMSEGIVEKSALKKRTDDSDKPKEPKRVSWHEDSELQHSYHSDISMTVQRSPVDDCDTALFGEGAAVVDSGDILETLESLRQQNSESDMTNSGSSVTSSEGSDIETQGNAKQVYLQYAAAKGISSSSKEGTIDSGVGGMSECGRNHGHEMSPLESLECLGSLDGSFSSRKFNVDDDCYRTTKDSSPLEQLERLSSLRDLPLPDLNYSGCEPPLGAEASGRKYRQSRGHQDPKQCGDPTGDQGYTTSESESDFDAEVANQHLRRLSLTTSKDKTGIAHGEMKKTSSCVDPAGVLPKSADAQPAAHLVQKQRAHKQGPPPVLPKPKPPPSILHLRSGPIRQPQMGKGKHFDRSRHMSSSSSSTSSSSSSTSSDLRQPPPPPAPS
ncbi:hypothetical protein Btru_031589 [Bulinus truncatus]|nr:hypothetical protein Btru_031589 [Bulinus truncatus]